MKIHFGKSFLRIAFAAFTLLLCGSCAPDVFLTGIETEPTSKQTLTDQTQPPPQGPTLAKKIPTPVKTQETEDMVQPEKTKKPEEIPALVKTEKTKAPAPSKTPALPPKKKKKKTNQELLDSALEFCQASYDFWEQGDLENAIESLDQAYSLILKVDPGQNSDLLQQREDLRITISKRIMAVYSSRYTVANGNHKAIPLVMNRYVQNAIDLLKGRERKFFLNAYRRSGRYRPAIVKALKEAGLPEELSWLPLIESGFKVRALSRARALGMWQFIASTGYKYGLKRDRWIDERMDPVKSTAAAIDYLKELHQIFGDWDTVLAAYNCGEGRVLRVIHNQKINYLDHFWDLYQKLPRETAFYVPKFLAVLHILENPEAYGFTLPPVDDAIQTDVVTTDKEVHVKTIAKELDVSYGLLKELNPALRRNSTPNRPYAFQVPKGKGAMLVAKLDHIPLWRPPIPSYVTHRVRKGESLSVIARRYRTSVRAIVNLNGLRSSRFIKAGWKLKIPTGRRYVSRPKPPQKVAAMKTSGKPQDYVVGKGDSLWKIAKHFGTTAESIQSLNKLKGTSLSAGKTLKIPASHRPTKKMKTRAYTILKGDSPYLIAKKHQMNLSEFLRLNNLTPRSTIFPGQILLVKAQ
ncbi:MAG: LysM peptidoglycan-binding domain-containing protein [Desulfobacteraceae bacterium]|nr:LysM peptidoglycan-binding domain-containing protein [Desulfobacteraceae bacterium]